MASKAKAKSRYAKVSGTLHRHLKTEVSTLEEMGVHEMCLSYISDNQTDGFIPPSVIEKFCRKAGRGWKRLLAKLLEPKIVGTDDEPTPWLHRTEHGYCLHDYTHENITKQQSEDTKSAGAARKAAYRAQQKQPLRDDVPGGQDAGQDTGQGTRHPTAVPPGPKTQDTRHKTQVKERERAHADLEPTTAELLGLDHERRYFRQRLVPPTKGRGYFEALKCAARWCDDTAQASGKPPAFVVKTVLDGLFASTNSRVTGDWGMRFLGTDCSEFYAPAQASTAPAVPYHRPMVERPDDGPGCTFAESLEHEAAE